MPRPKTIEDGERVSLVLSKKQLERVRYMAIHMSKTEGRQITVSEAIRKAVELTYPVPQDKQMSFLEN